MAYRTLATDKQIEYLKILAQRHNFRDCWELAAQHLGCSPSKAQAQLTKATATALIEKYNTPAPERCPVCGDALPEAQRDRRVTHSGRTVCGKASCEASE